VCKLLWYIIGSFAAYGEAYSCTGPIVGIGVPHAAPVKNEVDANEALKSAALSAGDKN
jgi:hypothetical protein